MQSSLSIKRIMLTWNFCISCNIQVKQCFSQIPFQLFCAISPHEISSGRIIPWREQCTKYICVSSKPNLGQILFGISILKNLILLYSQKECGRITKVKTSYSENTLDSIEFCKPMLTTLEKNLGAGIKRTIFTAVTCVRNIGKTKQQMNYAANKRRS